MGDVESGGLKKAHGSTGSFDGDKALKKSLSKAFVATGMAVTFKVRAGRRRLGGRRSHWQSLRR